jgi:hypothetical protein
LTNGVKCDFASTDSKLLYAGGIGAVKCTRKPLPQIARSAQGCPASVQCMTQCPARVYEGKPQAPEVVECITPSVTTSKPAAAPTAAVPADQWPKLVQVVAGYRAIEDKGAGDTLKRIATKAGAAWLVAMLKKTGVDCGCAGRQRRMNERYPYS